MSTQITTAFVRQYNKNVEILSQQEGTVLRNTVRNEKVVGQFAFFEQISSTAVAAASSRHTATSLTSTPHARRRVTPVAYHWADAIDWQDDARILIDPKSPYAKNAGYAMGRKMDEVILTAVSGTAYTGVDGASSTSFDSNMIVTISGSALTITGMRQAKAKLDGQNIPPMDRYMICHPDRINIDLYAENTIISADYNNNKVLPNGQIGQFLGFNIVPTTLCPTGTCYFWHKDAMLFVTSKEMTTYIDRRPDLQQAYQVYVSGMFGATRMNENGVAKITITEL